MCIAFSIRNTILVLCRMMLSVIEDTIFPLDLVESHFQCSFFSCCGCLTWQKKRKWGRRAENTGFCLFCFGHINSEIKREQCALNQKGTEATSKSAYPFNYRYAWIVKWRLRFRFHKIFVSSTCIHHLFHHHQAL